MPTFIVLGNTTDRGRRGVADVPARLDAARRVLERLGGRRVGIYLTMGPYDFVSVFEAPDDETAAKYILAVSARGYVKTISLKAFTETDLRRILGGSRPA